MKIAIGADHRGFEYKNEVQKKLSEDITWIDCGTNSSERTDYPEYAINVSTMIQEKKADCGILLCGTGIGMAIVANRFFGIYAGVVWNEEIARLAVEDDHVNVLVLPADFVSLSESTRIIQAWLSASFAGGRYQQRIAMIDGLGGVRSS